MSDAGQGPRVPGTGTARALVWVAVAVGIGAAWIGGPSTALWQVSAADGGCRLTLAGVGPPCPCPRWPGRIRLLLGQPITLNRAGVEDLQAISGIGPARAAAIVAERDAGGPFRALEDLRRVPGVGPATIARLRGSLAVEESGCGEPSSGPPAADLPQG